MHLVLSFSLWEDILAREILCSIKKRLFPLNVVDTVDKIRAETISKGSRAEERRKEKMYKWRQHKRREVKETVEGRLLSFPLAADDRGHSRSRQVHNTWQLNICYISLGTRWITWPSSPPPCLSFLVLPWLHQEIPLSSFVGYLVFPFVASLVCWAVFFYLLIPPLSHL